MELDTLNNKRIEYDIYPFYLLFSYFIFFKSTSLYATLWRRQV